MSLCVHLHHWQEKANVFPGQPVHDLECALQIFRDIKERRSFGRPHWKRLIVGSRKQVTQKFLEIKVSPSPQTI